MKSLEEIVHRDQLHLAREHARAVLDGRDDRAVRLARVAHEAGPGFVKAPVWAEGQRQVAREEPGRLLAFWRKAGRP